MHNHIVYAQKGVSSKWLRDVDASDYFRKYIPTGLTQNQVNQLRANGIAVGVDEDQKTKIFTDDKGLSIDLIRALRLNLKEDHQGNAWLI